MHRGQDADLDLVICDGASRTFLRGTVRVPAVRPTSCTVVPGMRVALTGPSGSGKSTLLHLLAGLETPTAGTVSWPGLGGPPQGRPGVVGLVFQGPSLVPALDVVENVTLPLLLAGADAVDAVSWAHEALDRLDIGGLARKLPEEISGGQAQRVAIARVLASAPRLILADEPTGQLDHATGERVLTVLLETADELDAALVVTTHDEQVARRLALRWRMADGVLATEEIS
ncbi:MULTISPECIES: ABC transporter ATP-binding protein [unclassified Pseudonocardia]|uniref:ABC transporter ATP-binding protein n=1 Tax=unclassified Pseudonocardia TaxID=2619320 RepID=UPI00095A057B|nr:MULTISPECIES: ABC transporter ATP-binding protein [unclassified Pseudonocardia]MBN9098097.1 ABC transporter ATP-binding protein [Pseudonocardia sp.]OJY40286.1 MAG: ABC transporter ATP-binding protein [Pseudonocardia sp. 73-21]